MYQQLTKKTCQAIESDCEEETSMEVEEQHADAEQKPEVKAVEEKESPKEEESTLPASPAKIVLEEPVVPLSKPVFTVDPDADISQLEAPTFTTLTRGPPEPMLRLKWQHRVNLMGDKVLNPMIHCCDRCMKPILIYGRMVRVWRSSYKVQANAKNAIYLLCVFTQLARR